MSTVCDGHFPGRNSERCADALVAKTKANVRSEATRTIVQRRRDLWDLAVATNELLGVGGFGGVAGIAAPSLLDSTPGSAARTLLRGIGCGLGGGDRGHVPALEHEERDGEPEEGEDAAHPEGPVEATGER